MRTFLKRRRGEKEGRRQEQTWGRWAGQLMTSFGDLECKDSWGWGDAPTPAVGTGPRLLSSSLLFTFECLIGKAMSPRCECVTVTGVGVASCTGEKEGLVGQQQGWGGQEPDMRRGPQEGALPSASRHWARAVGDISPGEETPGQGCPMPACGQLCWNQQQLKPCGSEEGMDGQEGIPAPSRPTLLHSLSESPWTSRTSQRAASPDKSEHLSLLRAPGAQL